MTAGIDTESLTDKIYKNLLQRIINNKLRPGTRISYDSLMDEMKVSRTPLREAINRLNDDGLVVIKPRSGTFVKVPDQKGIQDLYDIRSALEELSIELSINNLPKSVLKSLQEEIMTAENELKKGNIEPFFRSDRNIHATLIEYSNNEILKQFWNTIEVQVQWYGVIMTTDYSRPFSASEMHKKIIESLIRRDLQSSKLLMNNHIDEIKNNMLDGNFN